MRLFISLVGLILAISGVATIVAPVVSPVVFSVVSPVVFSVPPLVLSGLALLIPGCLLQRLHLFLERFKFFVTR